MSRKINSRDYHNFEIATLKKGGEIKQRDDSFFGIVLWYYKISVGEFICPGSQNKN